MMLLRITRLELEHIMSIVGIREQTAKLDMYQAEC
jgi:hypothetical protein